MDKPSHTPVPAPSRERKDIITDPKPLIPGKPSTPSTGWPPRYEPPKKPAHYWGPEKP